MYMYTPSLFWPPFHLGHHRASSRGPCAVCRFSLVTCLTHGIYSVPMSIPVRRGSASWSQVSWANRWASLKALFLLRDAPLSFPRASHLSSGQTWPIRGQFQAQHCPSTSCVTGKWFLLWGTTASPAESSLGGRGDEKNSPFTVCDFRQYLQLSGPKFPHLQNEANHSISLMASF